MSTPPPLSALAGLEVAVAVLTFRRPADLAAILPGLVAQIEASGVRAHVLVVDNDPDAGAAATAHAAGPAVRYVHEPRPGIAAARNRALTESADSDLLVFIDDDERPVDAWLALLIATYAASRPAAVVGPVVSVYDQEPDPWVTAGRFFDRRRLPTGTLVDVAATNNLLLDLRQIASLGLSFDERFGLSGGSDTLFTRALVRAGGRMVWCDEAVVVDVVPAARVTRQWVLRRAFRSGNGWSRTCLELADSRYETARERMVLTGRGLLRAVTGAGQSCLGLLVFRKSWQARGARTFARGIGMVSGAYGYVYVEYRR